MKQDWKSEVKQGDLLTTVYCKDDKVSVTGGSRGWRHAPVAVGQGNPSLSHPSRRLERSSLVPLILALPTRWKILHPSFSHDQSFTVRKEELTWLMLRDEVSYRVQRSSEADPVTPWPWYIHRESRPAFHSEASPWQQAFPHPAPRSVWGDTSSETFCTFQPADNCQLFF